jgi:uncharacterized RmlC-like cupin family protein
MYIPIELSSMFKDDDFKDYPFVKIPQFYEDERGTIANIADGQLGDVAVITSETNAVRANHVHKEDWHFSYLLNGSMDYFWKGEDRIERSVIVNPGQMVYSPPGIPHKMIFRERSTFIAISAKNRSAENYEQDTQRLPEDFFKSNEIL